MELSWNIWYVFTTNKFLCSKHTSPSETSSPSVCLESARVGLNCLHSSSFRKQSIYLPFCGIIFEYQVLHPQSAVVWLVVASHWLAFHILDSRDYLRPRNMLTTQWNSAQGTFILIQNQLDSRHQSFGHPDFSWILIRNHALFQRHVEERGQCVVAWHVTFLLCKLET